MSRYIDREFIGNAVSHVPTEIFSTESGLKLMVSAIEVINLIKQAPTIDIVHCKECVKHNTHRCHMAFDLIATEDDDFCSYGERKDNETD